MSDPSPQDHWPAPPDAGDRSAAPGAQGPVPGRPTPPPESVPGASLPLPPVADEGADRGLSDPAEDPDPAGAGTAVELPRLQNPRKGRRLVPRSEASPSPL